MKSQIKTPISYYGGKQAIVNHLLAMVPEHDVYTEVFFGGGALFWAKHPAHNETINDRLDIVINFYRVLKTNYKALKKEIDATLHSRSDHAKAWRIIKGLKSSPVQKAWAFWMCSNFSHSCKIGGGLKWCNDLGTNIPLQFINKKKYFIEALSTRLEYTTIENLNAVKLLKYKNVKNAFHYLDPPYFNADQGHYKGYTENDFIDLLDTCRQLKGKFLLSNYNSPILDEYILANDWHKQEITHRLKAPRKSGPVKTEVLVSNYKSPCGTLELFNRHPEFVEGLNTQY